MYMSNYADNQTFYCPICGGKLEWTGMVSPWYCEHCDKAGTLDYDEENDCEYVVFDEEYEGYYDEVSEEDLPDCCAACGGPYPQCMTSCKIFDD